MQQSHRSKSRGSAGRPPRLPADIVISGTQVVIIPGHNKVVRVSRQDFEKVTREKCPVSPNKQEVRGQAAKGSGQRGQSKERVGISPRAWALEPCRSRLTVFPCRLLFYGTFSEASYFSIK